MLTNKITGFSADLLNTVRGILGEAKKCPADCECEKCEAEEMKEGSMPTSDEPTDANKKTADKVRAMMAKEKKPMKEEILEMVEEASSGLADKAKKSGVSLSTLKKVYARGIAAWNSGHRPGTTPQQWAHARVNSYITKGKGTYHGADKDLRSEGTDIPFEGPYRKAGEERKDEYGNKVKNVAKHLAKKAMNKQKNEEIDPDLEAELKATRVTKKSIADSQKTRERASRMKEDSEHTNCGTPECCGQCDTPGQIDETAKIVAHLQKRYGDNIRKSHVRSAASDFGVDASKLAKAVRTKLGKNMLDEEEQIDEISAKTAVNAYAKRNAKAFNDGQYDDEAEKDYNKLDKQGDRIQKKFGAKIVQKAQKAASKKIFGEEAEQIDEISKGTLGRYINKAKDSIDTASYRQGHKEAHGSSSKPLEKKLTKRHKGISAAVSKLTKEDAEQIDELSKATMGRYVNKAAERMSTQGVTAGLKIAADEKSKKNFDTIAKRQKGISTAVSKLTKEEQDFVDSLNNEIFEKADPYDIAGMIKKAKAKNDPNHPAMKHVAAIEDIKKHGGALSVQGDHVRSLIKALGEDANIGQIDEISKDAALKYLSANKKDDTKAKEAGDYDRVTKRMRGTDMAVRKYTAKPGSKYVRVPATEEVEITEARGRPRKAGAKDFTIHPKTKEKLMHNNPADMKRIERLQKNGVLEKPKVEAGQHIMNQLQKAKTSMLGGSKINFTHGDSKEVSGPHAAKILTKYAGMKPNEKEDFQKFVGHSHENLMKHV